MVYSQRPPFLPSISKYYYVESLTRLLRITRKPNPNGVAGGGGEGKPTAVETAASSERDTVSAKADGDGSDGTTSSGEGVRNKRALMESPPSDDVCPICFGSFDVPCRAPCGHWFCGEYWNFSSALLQCKCPMCSQHIPKLISEASLCCRTEAEVRKVLKDVGDYNRLFVGGIAGILLKLTAIPLYIKRMSHDLLNPDRPGLHLHELRLIAVKSPKLLKNIRAETMFLGIVYSFSPFDFLHIGHRHIIDVFDYSAFVLSFIFYLAGLYLRRRRVRNVRELAGIQARQD